MAIKAARGIKKAGEAGEEEAPSRQAKWLEIAATVILLVGSLATAWNALEASRWGSVQASGYARAGSQRSQWIAAQSLASQLALYDVVTFVSWSEAKNSGDEQLAAFHERRFRPEFRPAFDAWLATKPLTNPDAPSSPVLMREYQNSSLAKANEFDQRAQEYLQSGEDANMWNTRYVTNGFYAALAIYFAGVAPRFRKLALRTIVVAAGAGLLIFSIAQAATFPIT